MTCMYVYVCIYCLQEKILMKRRIIHFFNTHSFPFPLNDLQHRLYY